ncbi:MAG: hypothetical protein WC629_02945 [Candidatus Paceibacterota bacterium]|jgi:hypothetical protein
MDTLSLLLGSVLRVKMMRLFLFNPGRNFDIEYIEGKTNAKIRDIEEEISFFKKLGLVKIKKIKKVIVLKKGKETIEKKKKFSTWTLDQSFKYIEALTDFLVRTHSLEHKAIVRRLEKAGRIKAVLVSGIFMGDAESRLDLFIVGDNVKSGSIDRIVRGIESEMGKDIRYAVLSGPDFSYRVNMNDKLVRDVLDFPHTVLVDKIGISR